MSNSRPPIIVCSRLSPITSRPLPTNAPENETRGGPIGVLTECRNSPVSLIAKHKELNLNFRFELCQTPKQCGSALVVGIKRVN